MRRPRGLLLVDLAAVSDFDDKHNIGWLDAIDHAVVFLLRLTVPSSS